VSEARIEARDLVVRYGSVRAVDGVSFEIGAGETLALVGESGSGKTTTGRGVLGLARVESGSVLYRREAGGAPTDLARLDEKALRPLRRELQIVFQDPLASLDPRQTAGDAVAEGLIVHRIAQGEGARTRVAALFERVGLGGELRERFPHELSGGERQRVAIARALAVEPRFLVLDEPVSALDVSVQVQILNLLDELQGEFGLSYLFIAHDLAVVRYLADRIAVMYCGRIVETGTASEIFDDARHPYTQALLAAMPVLDPAVKPGPPLPGEPPSPVAPPSGCPFHPRCPVAEERCAREVPRRTSITPTHAADCHLLQDP
jgi:oligopeptide/dipeptide ABC transporter ATP-binding protein